MFFLLMFIACLWLQCVLAQTRTQSMVVEARNITLPAGSNALLPCHNQRIVWRQDRLRDRQRVVHWDVYRSRPHEGVERVLDLFPGGSERLYSNYNKGRINISPDAFIDGNFSLIIQNVGANDRGLYTCNLHHHYCNIHQALQMQLNITKSAHKERRFWDGEKSVFVVLAGSTIVLPCMNRRPLWTEGSQEDQQQVVHWDWQPPGVRPDGAERLVDLYASGEERKYGPHFLREKMNITADAFSRGDFSLRISDLQPTEKGLYVCHLHHHYCGLHERRIFRLIVGAPLLQQPVPTRPRELPPTEVPANNEPTKKLTVIELPFLENNEDPNTNMVETARVFNVIVPEPRSHFLNQLGYVLAIFLLLTLIVAAVILLTRSRRKRELEYDVRRSERGQPRTAIEMEPTGLKNCNQDDLRDYKNNIMKEQAEMSYASTSRVIDLNKEMEKLSWK
ncbi:matrix remodeling-associated protein 8b isoform X1 [Alosa sapidissima]|uniref:matrix remodeling-associated protein 8b isoform X1 n=1 Tax=Alosa sapidissima TaxID=34773 RepID=UPI001C08FFBB|nr:matrix remodeling-associated protein 8b isoform X1 [Alosa sapidissima]